MGVADTTSRVLRRGATLVVDALLPPLCLGCNAVVETPGTLCAPCWTKVGWLAPPLCACCGLPFEFDPGLAAPADLRCAACLRDPPAFARARAVFRYDEASRNLILAFKHADRTHAAPAFGQWLARAGGEVLEQADIVAPVVKTSSTSRIRAPRTAPAWRGSMAKARRTLRRRSARPSSPCGGVRRLRTSRSGTQRLFAVRAAVCAISADWL